jgi:D-alanyl-D-alanine dipeptidase
MRVMRRGLPAAALLLSAACASAPPPVDVRGPLPMPETARAERRDRLGATTQLVVVTTASWDTTGGTLRRYERATPADAWRAVGAAVPVVVGQHGLAWDDPAGAREIAPPKREGDGRAPAGVFALDTVFGVAPASEATWIRMPYLPVTAGTECVDDVASSHYNTIVDRAAVGRVDWTSAEPMRRIDQYRLGVTVAYNAPPRAGRGSCIFMHIWAGPDTYTAGCTAMAERDLTALVLWMDRTRRPALVQLPESEYARLRGEWLLP